MSPRLPAIIAALLMAAATPATGQRQQIDPEGYVDRAGIWNHRHIPVCWESSAESYGTEKQWVQAAVLRAIEGDDGRVSAVRFVDQADGRGAWPECLENDLGIRIAVRDGQPRSLVGQQWTEVGGNKVEAPTGMTLNFEFKRAFLACAPKREHCIKAIAVHEFLHALGFLHEHLRPDTSPQCRKEFPGYGDFPGHSPLQVGEYDPDSYVNYCRNIYAGDIQLSEGDLFVLRTFYSQ